MNYIEPRKDVIKLAILVMESLIDTKVKEKFLMSLIKPEITILEKSELIDIEELENRFRNN